MAQVKWSLNAVDKTRPAFDSVKRSLRSVADTTDHEMTRVAESIKKKFSLPDIGKDILKGAGLFGGFEIAQRGAEMLVGHFKEAAEAAKSIEESMERQLAITRQIIGLHQTDEQKMAALEKQRADVGRQLAEAESQKFKQVFSSHPENLKQVLGLELVNGPKRERTKEEQEDVNRLAEEYKKLGLEIEQAHKKQADTKTEETAKALLSDRDKRTRSFTEGLKRQEDAFDSLIKTQREKNDTDEKNRKELGELSEKYREIADPARRFKKEIEEINALMSAGKLRADEGAKAIEGVQRAMSQDEVHRINDALSEFFDELDYMERATSAFAKHAQDAAGIIAQGFEDAVFAGANLRDMIRGIGEDLMRYIFHEEITKSLGSFLTGSFDKIFGGGHAAGGPVTAGTAYLVGEQGPELFASSSPGRIIPNHMVASAASGGGNTYVINAPGATAGTVQELRAMIMSLAGPGVTERRSLGSVMDARLRGAMA